MNDVCIVYHFPCLDGLAAAYAASIRFPGAEFIPYNYDVTNIHKWYTSPCRVMYFLDCAPSKDVHDILSKHLRKKVMILAHHLDNRRDLADVVPAESFIFNEAKSGCVLAWEYFHPGTPIPLLLQCIGERELGTSETHKYLGYALPNRNLNTISDMARVVQGGEAEVSMLVKEGMSYATYNYNHTRIWLATLTVNEMSFDVIESRLQPLATQAIHVWKRIRFPEEEKMKRTQRRVDSTFL